MAAVQEDKYLVLKNADIQKYLNDKDQEKLLHLCQKIAVGRISEAKNPNNEYWVVNQDEPYAREVLRVILEGEDRKYLQHPTNIPQ